MGTTRNTRAIRALRPGWLKVDGRTQRQLLARTVPTAALFNFFDADGRLAGAWNAFFENVPLVRYAAISEMNVAREGDYFRAALQKLGSEIDLSDRGQIAAAWNVIERLMLHFYCRIDSDARLFVTLPAEKTYAAALQQAISSVLAPNYRSVLAWAEWLAQTHPPPPALLRRPGVQADRLAPPGLNAAWWGRGAGLDDVQPGTETKEFVRELTAATWSTKSTVEQLVAEARGAFAERYAKPQNLPPHFAIYLAFIRQFAGAQEAINQLPSRHCDYFYRTVLGLAPAGPVPDTAYVAFTAAPGGWSELPAGTALLAGKDPTGQPVVYRTLKPTTVTESALAQMATVFLAAPPAAGGTGFYVAPNAASADGAGAPLPPGDTWATFGEQQAGLAPGARTMADGQIGFALSSPVLQLEEGVRTITLEISFSPPAPQPAGLTATGDPSSGTTKTDATQTLLWLADYSSAKGWAVPSGPTQCTIEYIQPASGAPVPVSLTATLNLAVGDPGCINYVPAPTDPAYDVRTPVLRVRYPNPLAWFDGPDPVLAASLSAAFAAACVSGLTVSVSAKGLRDLVLAGPAGKLVPPGKPVAPFGSPPQAGRFAIGKVELFRKQLTTLTVTLEWQGLPAGPKGLSDYYADYNTLLIPAPSPAIGNTQYTASLSALINRTWEPVLVAESLPLPSPPPPVGPPAPSPAPSASKYLFHWPKCMDLQTPATLGTLDPSSSWSALPPPLPTPLPPLPPPLPAFNPAPDYALAGPLEYTPATVTGFLGLTLSAPDYLFGQTFYPGLVSTIAFNNALVLIQAAKAPKGTPLPSTAETNPASAYVRLKTPAPKTIVGRLRSLVGQPPSPTYTFKPKLFTDLAKVTALPADLSTAVTAAGYDPATILAGAAKLKGKTFTNPQEFQQAIGAAVGLDPTVDSDAEVLAQIIIWLANLNAKGPSAQAIAESMLALTGIQSPPPLPLVPTIVGVSVDYTASTTLDFTGAGSTAPGWDQLWQLAPLAVYPRPSGVAPLLPPVEQGGCLYLGLGNIQPPETVSLLFIMAAVPAAAAPPDDPPVWSCLVGDAWTDITPSVHDGTEGFLRTGIVRIDLPETADTTHQVMPGGCVWLRAQVALPAVHLRSVQVLPHAAEAAWVPPDPANDAVTAAHFAQPLPPATITGLQVPVAAVAKVTQPLSGSGGAPAETGDDFNTRVSERLRHKGRAVAAPDYERLLLGQFGTVFSARVVPPASAADAGTVTLVVLPTVTAPPDAPPPGFVAGDLLAFEQALANVAPLSATVVAINPVYESIWVRVEVDFAKDRSRQFYQTQLTADLKAFISPWIYNQPDVKDPVATFHASDFSVFVRGRSYVLQVGKCDVFPGKPPLPDAPPPDPSTALDRIAPGSPRAMLISADTHQLVPLPQP